MAVKLNSIFFSNEFRDEQVDYLLGSIGSRQTAFLDVSAEWYFQADLNNRIYFSGLTAHFVDANLDPTGRTWASYGFIEGDTVLITGTTSNNSAGDTIVSFSADGLTATFSAAFTNETSSAGLLTGITEVTGISYRYNLIENSAAVDYNSLVDNNELRFSIGSLNYASYTQTTAVQQGIYSSNKNGSVIFRGHGRQFTATGGAPFVFDTIGDTITWAAGDFINEGIKIGDSITITGSTSNNITTTIVSVTATVLGVAANLTNESDTNAVITRAAVLNRFTIEHTFDVIPFYLQPDETDFLQNIAPSYYFNTECLRYVYKADLLYNLQDPNRLHTTDELDFLIGNTGWRNENFNGDINYYSISQPTFTIGGVASTNPDHLQVTNFSITITNTTNTPFSNNNTKFVVGHFWLPENVTDYKNTSTDFVTNFMYDRAKQTLGSASVNGDNFGTAKQVLANIVGTFTSSSVITITGSIDLSSAYEARITAATNKRLVLFVQVQKHSLVTELADLVTLWADTPLEYEPNYENVSVGGNTVDFIEQYHPDFSGLNAKPTAGFFIEDDVIARSRFFVDNSNGAVIDSISCVLKAYHATYGEFELERQDFSFAGAVTVSGVQTLSINNSRGFIQDSTYKGNWVKLDRDSASDSGDDKYYILYYGFKLRWEYFKQLANVNSQFFDTSLDFNGFNHNWQRYWEQAGWTIYFSTELFITENDFQNEINTDSEVTIYNYNEASDWSDTDIKVLEDSTNTDLGAYMITTADMRIEATHTYIGTGTLPAISNINGEIKIEVYELDGIFNVAEISTIDPLANPDGQLLVSTLGTNLLKKEFIAPDKYKFTCLIDSSKLNLGATDYKISSRIYHALPLTVPEDEGACVNSLSVIISGTGDMYVFINTPIGKDCEIIWGDGATTTATGTGVKEQYMHTYGGDGVPVNTTLYICGDVTFISEIVLVDYNSITLRDDGMIRAVDLTNVGSAVTMTNIQVSGISMCSNIIMPDSVTSCDFIEIGHNVYFEENLALKSLDLSMFDTIDSLIIFGMNGLKSLTINPSLAMNTPTSVLQIRETALRTLFPIGVTMFPNSNLNTYKNISIPNMYLDNRIETMIDQIYAGRTSFDNSVPHTMDWGAGTRTISGIYQAPTGYIQADAVTVGNDGTPATQQEKVYVLENQNNDNTVVKKYKWTIDY